GGAPGYGRAYREQLRGMWGIVDLDDCEAAARFLADEARVDPTRLCIRGGSAGGSQTPGGVGVRPHFRGGGGRPATRRGRGPATTGGPTWRPWRSRPTSSRAATSTGSSVPIPSAGTCTRRARRSTTP